MEETVQHGLFILLENAAHSQSIFGEEDEPHSHLCH